jgi:alkylmercury lyase
MGIPAAPENLADRLVASVSQPGSARTSPALYRVLLRQLSHGEPITIDELAAAAGQSPEWVRCIVSSWPDAEYDREGRINGWGLTLRPTPHKFSINGKQLYTWCALDTLFLPAVIGRPALIESPCAATSAPIRLTVDPVAGVTTLGPATAVVSIVTPEQVSSVRTAFCNPGRFFVTADAARDWQAKHPGMEVLSVADAYLASRPLSKMLLDGSPMLACCAS